LYFFNPLRTPAKKSVFPLVEGSSAVVGVLELFVGNCITERFSQGPVTTHFYAKASGCTSLNRQLFHAKSGVFYLALNNAELQSSTSILLVVGAW